jgi:tRNA-dihydrouridine synthase
VRDAVTVPVIANGDIVDTASARSAMAASGAAGVMVGRGAQGAPWRLAEIAADLFGAPAPDIPVGNALSDVISEHYEEMLRFYGAEHGVRIARKHLGWYIDEAGVDPTIRARMMVATEAAEVLSLIARAFADTARRAA